MKAITAVCATGAPVPPIASGRVQRARGGENEEIQMYIAKLKDLVPFMPRNRKISKLEVIQHVIEYIGELQSALDTHPAAGTFDPAAVLGPVQASAPRRPLGPLSSSNSLLSATPAPLSPSSQQHTMHTQSPDKTSQLDRLVSC